MAGRILRIAREGDLAVYYSYDSIDRLTAEVWRKKSDNAQVYGFFYDYDGANNRLKLRREFGTGTEWDSAYFAYAADNSLTQRRKQTPPSTFLSTYYSYDANGALIKEWTPGGGGGWGNQAWGSSPYGGGTGDDVVYYEYGAQQLVTRIIPTSEAPTQFFYDGRLNRYLINQAGTPTYYPWDGLNQLEERNADGSLKARYTHGNYRQYGIGSVVEVERVANSTTYFQYLHMDHRGTAYAVTDASQNTQLSYVQDAFGTQLAATGGANPNVPNNLIYQSNWLTLNIGGRSYGVSRYRLYDPDLGIFLSRDFLPFLNKYRAFSNNSVGLVDRLGLEAKECEVMFYFGHQDWILKTIKAEKDALKKLENSKVGGIGCGSSEKGSVKSVNDLISEMLEDPNQKHVIAGLQHPSEQGLVLLPNLETDSAWDALEKSSKRDNLKAPSGVNLDIWQDLSGAQKLRVYLIDWMKALRKEADTLCKQSSCKEVTVRIKFDNALITRREFLASLHGYRNILTGEKYNRSEVGAFAEAFVSLPGILGPIGQGIGLYNLYHEKELIDDLPFAEPKGLKSILGFEFDGLNKNTGDDVLEYTVKCCRDE